MAPFVEVHDLHLYYKNFSALSGVTLSVERGEVNVIIGPMPHFSFINDFLFLLKKKDAYLWLFF